MSRADVTIHAYYKGPGEEVRICWSRKYSQIFIEQKTPFFSCHIEQCYLNIFFSISWNALFLHTDRFPGTFEYIISVCHMFAKLHWLCLSDLNSVSLCHIDQNLFYFFFYFMTHQLLMHQFAPSKNQVYNKLFTSSCQHALVLLQVFLPWANSNVQCWNVNEISFRINVVT